MTAHEKDRDCRKEPVDRRRHERRREVRPAKVRDRRMLLFSGGETCDISEGGMLLRVERARAFAQGDELDVVVAWGNDALVRGEAMTRARVRRVTPIDHHHQALALEFERPASAAGRIAA